jgi:outer membrane cobalamin receptor
MRGTFFSTDDARAASSAIDKPEKPVRLEPVVVSAGRVEQALQDVPANVTVLNREDIERSAARTLDDLLRQIPGFSLFRRSSSLVAHPTTQGVSLRGIGPSGVSRTLVLLDGVPLNDPFGGWVYWSKVPLESIEPLEVVRGGGSALYGNYALGGVINIVTRKPQASGIQGKLDGGTRDTAGVGGSLQWTKQLFPMHLVTAGIDARCIDGESDENIFNFAGTSVTTWREAGGEQSFIGVFVQDIFTPLPRLQITGALRFDYWWNGDALRSDRSIATGQIADRRRPGMSPPAISITTPKC